MVAGRISSACGVQRRDSEETLSAWLNRHSAAMLGTAALTVVAPSGLWLALTAGASFAALAYRERLRHALLKPYGGYANQLTALRLALVLTAAALMNDLPRLWLWVLLAGNVAVDVVDGFVARRANQASAFGAVFDREVDAVFVLTAYVYFFAVEDLPAVVLLPGLLPYAYRLATRLRAGGSAPDHRERFASFLAGANFAVLLVAIGAPAELMLGIVSLSAALVVLSFSMSFASLYLDGHSAR
jgi:phosphatidylglycerophosphate synthase